MRPLSPLPPSGNPNVEYTYIYFKVSQKIPLDITTKMCFYEGGGL